MDSVPNFVENFLVSHVEDTVDFCALTKFKQNSVCKQTAGGGKRNIWIGDGKETLYGVKQAFLNKSVVDVFVVIVIIFLKAADIDFGEESPV
jgi:hypothetical protein